MIEMNFQGRFLMTLNYLGNVVIVLSKNKTNFK